MKNIYKIWRGITIILTGILNGIVLLFAGARVEKNFTTCGMIKIRNYSGKRCITIGENVYINSHRMADPIGGQSRTIFCVVGDGRIKIGNNVGISNTVLYSADKIIIGDGVVIGGGCKIYDNDFHSIYAQERLNGNINVPHAPVVIEDNVFIGGHCIILKGVTIGSESVIGAGSVVTRDVPAQQVWGG